MCVCQLLNTQYSQTHAYLHFRNMGGTVFFPSLSYFSLDSILLKSPFFLTVLGSRCLCCAFYVRLEKRCDCDMDVSCQTLRISLPSGLFLLSSSLVSSDQSRSGMRWTNVCMNRTREVSRMCFLCLNEMVTSVKQSWIILFSEKVTAVVGKGFFLFPDVLSG